MNQSERAVTFANLHVKGNPLILFNIWDAGSARALEEMGAKAIATGSWSVAAASGFGDGEKIPFDLVIANIQRITSNTDLPVTLDMEGGYAVEADELRQNVMQVIEAGVIGINFEDQIVGGEGLHPIETQQARIAVIRQAADQAAIPLFINARSDVFLQAPPAAHNDQQLAEVLARANAYAEAGATGFFAPGLRNARMIEKLCAESPLPVNILALGDTPSAKQMADLGVARISYGATPYRQMIAFLKEIGSKALAME